MSLNVVNIDAINRCASRNSLIVWVSWWHRSALKFSTRTYPSCFGQTQSTHPYVFRCLPVCGGGAIGRDSARLIFSNVRAEFWIIHQKRTGLPDAARLYIDRVNERRERESTVLPSEKLHEARHRLHYSSIAEGNCAKSGRERERERGGGSLLPVDAFRKLRSRAYLRNYLTTVCPRLLRRSAQFWLRDLAHELCRLTSTHLGLGETMIYFHFELSNSCTNIFSTYST